MIAQLSTINLLKQRSVLAPWDGIFFHLFLDGKVIEGIVTAHRLQMSKHRKNESLGTRTVRGDGREGCQTALATWREKFPGYQGEGRYSPLCCYMSYQVQLLWRTNS